MLQYLPAAISIGTSLFGNKGPSRQDMIDDLEPFRTALTGQKDRIDEYRDRDSEFWGEQENSMLNQAYNSADFSNMLGGKMNFGAASGIQNQQNMDRTTKGVQGVGGLMGDAWMNLQKHTDDMYQNYLSGENNYSQALTGVRTAQYQQGQERMQGIIGAAEGLMQPGDDQGNSIWSKMIG
tara:strand:- start:3940 stop:4479 length:540 start_codon:yes stop_codon:yes gene_type:complete